MNSEAHKRKTTHHVVTALISFFWDVMSQYVDLSSYELQGVDYIKMGQEFIFNARQNVLLHLVIAD